MEQILHDLAEYVQKQYEEATKCKMNSTEDGLENIYYTEAGRAMAYKDVLEHLDSLMP